MKIDVNYTQLAAEFVIVFFGVAVALAADSWREGLLEARLETGYLERLRVDLADDRTWLEDQLKRFSNAYDASHILIRHFESIHAPEEDDEPIIELFLNAANIGGSAAGVVFNDTFQELLATGRMNTIRSAELRYSLSNYYFAFEGLAEVRERIPRELLGRYLEHSPLGYYRFTSDGAMEFFNNDLTKLPSYVSDNIVESLHSDNTLLSDLNSQVASIGIYKNRIESLLRSNAATMDML